MDWYPYLDTAISDDWFCYRCGEYGVCFGGSYGEHDVVKRRWVIFPDNYVGPWFIDTSGKICIEQCLPLETAEASGCQVLVHLPRNWRPLTHYILDQRASSVLDADLNPIGSLEEFTECLLSGELYVPEGNV
jgi:hypothetical protein